MRRASRRALTARVFAASVLAASALLLSGAPAGAAVEDPPVSGDERATAYAGNLDRDKDGCDESVGLSGEVILFDDDPADGTLYLDIDPEDIPEGFTITGVVVKGGPGYNVYLAADIDEDGWVDLHSPINPANDTPYAISHWYACGEEDTTTTTQTTTSSGETTTSSSETTTTSGGSTTTSGGGAAPTPTSGGSAVGSAGLADTGYSAQGALLAAAALLLVGGALVAAARRRAFARD